MDYFNYCQGLTMTNRRFDELFGGPPRNPESIEQRHMDLAASIQAVTEEIVLRWVATCTRRPAMKNLVLAGGVALNCVANGRLLREGPFDDIWIQPAAAMPGRAWRGAVHVAPAARQAAHTPQRHDSQKGSFLGPDVHRDEIQKFLDANRVTARSTMMERRLRRCGAPGGREGQTRWFQGGWSSGRGRWARAASSAMRGRRKMQATMNLKIKFRESFRPFAPSCCRSTRTNGSTCAKGRRVHTCSWWHRSRGATLLSS